MNTYYIELDFVRAEIKETGIAISQGDYGRVKFSIAVKKDGEIITDAASADISFQLTNGYIVQGVLSGAEGLYDYIFQGNELQAPGKTIATVTLNYADGRTSSEAFSFDVRYNPLYGRFIDAGPYITDLENIKSQAQTYVEYLEKLIEQIKLEMGQTALTKESLANNFDITEEGVKALDAAAGRTLNLNKIDKTAIVQTESTDPTTVPSSPYFKQITDKLTSDLGGYKLYLTLSPLGLSDGCSILDIINALPAKSVFLYHEQYNGATINDMPPNYRNGGIIKILNIGGRYEIDFRRQNANSLLSPPEHYVGSVAGSNPATIEWSKNLTNADFENQSITNTYGLAINLFTFGNQNLKAIKIMGYINKALTAGTEYTIATNTVLKSRVNWYHNIFAGGKVSELSVYINIDTSGNLKITPKTAIASGAAINIAEYYV